MYKRQERDKEEDMSFNVAIDGPAGAGKSTVAKAVAAKRNFTYVDTGAMYRAMALFLIRKGVSPEDSAAISETCREADITIRYENGEQVVLLNGENVNGLIRAEEVLSLIHIFIVLILISLLISCFKFIPGWQEKLSRKKKAEEVSVPCLLYTSTIRPILRHIRIGAPSFPCPAMSMGAWCACLLSAAWFPPLLPCSPNTTGECLRRKESG